MAKKVVSQKLTCSDAPCKSCPYRKDVPSGVWAAVEYNKLPGYDGPNVQQAVNGGFALFFCHQNDGKLCAGWLGAHGPHNLLAVRMAAIHDKVDDKVMNYVSPIPVFASGAEAAAHGKKAIRRPNRRAKEMVAALTKQRERKSLRPGRKKARGK